MLRFLPAGAIRFKYRARREERLTQEEFGFREPRERVALPCEIVGDRGRTVAHLRDFSAGGCRVLSSRPYERQDLVVVTFRLRDGETVDFAAEVRWSSPVAPADVYRIGCRFIHSLGSRRRAEIMARDGLAPPQSLGRSGDSTTRIPLP